MLCLQGCLVSYYPPKISNIHSNISEYILWPFSPNSFKKTFMASTIPCREQGSVVKYEYLWGPNAPKKSYLQPPPPVTIHETLAFV